VSDQGPLGQENLLESGREREGERERERERERYKEIIREGVGKREDRFEKSAVLMDGGVPV